MNDLFELAFWSPVDMGIIAVVALLLFGPKRLPEFGKQLGTAMRELRKLTSEFTDAVNEAKVEPVVAPRAEPMHQAAIPMSIDQAKELTAPQAAVTELKSVEAHSTAAVIQVKSQTGAEVMSEKSDHSAQVPVEHSESIQ